MISRTLRPVDRMPHISIEEIAEALAYTYLAYYQGQLMQPRVVSAYSRAFGLDKIKIVPRDGLNPGFTAAFATLPHRKTLTIAIEGTTTVGQANALIEQWLGVRATGSVLGNYYSFFSSTATSVLARMAADTDIAAAMANGAYIFTFTGHSLGAAAADIASYTFKQANPQKMIRVIKFGCPRVGNTFYVNRTHTLIPKANVYVFGDPIHQFPSSSIFAMNPSNVIATGLRLASCSEDFLSMMNLTGGAMTSEKVEFSQSCGHFLDLAALIRAFTPANPWWNHMMRTYRMAMMNLLGGRDDILKYRFNFLEHNDENTWQSRWSPGMRDWVNLSALASPEPDAVEPISAQVATDVQSTVGSSGGDWGDPMEITAALPATERIAMPSLPPPVVTALQPRRRFRAPPSP